GEGKGLGPGGNFSHRGPAGLQDHRLRQVSVPGQQESARTAQEQSRVATEGSEVSSRYRGTRLSGAQESDHSVSGRRPQSSRHDFSSRPRNGAPGSWAREDDALAG